jgi:glutaredoxin-related protein
MTRSILSTAQIHPAIHQQISSLHSDIVEEVQSAIQAHRVVVVGMTQNPVVKSVRKHLSEAGIDYYYLEYGSYFSQWYRRLALKMWTGWPTFPMVFLDGVLLGGSQDVKALIASGELKEQKSSI